MLTFITVLAVLAMISKVGGIIIGTWLAIKAFNWVHHSSPRLAWILVGCFVVAGGLAAVGVNYLERARAEARAEAVADASQQRRTAANQAREEQAQAAEAERKHRADLVERWRAARRMTIEQWRKDLVDARAVGNLGTPPPMLAIEDKGSLVTVTNRTKAAACVLITRVATRNGGVLSRCTVGSNRCVALQAGATARWPTLRSGNSESCLTGTLEYRVGNVDHPDPGWWSQTALDAFGSEDPGSAFIERLSDASLTTEILRLERQIEERMRVER